MSRRLRPGPAPSAWAALLAAAVTACSPAAEAPTVSVDGSTFTVEVQDTDEGRAQGLSGRAEIPDGTGMLFRYDDADLRSYWMSGMLLSIDLAWIADGRVLAVETLQPCVESQPCPTHPSPGPVDTVLEVAAGALAGVQAGDEVIVELP